MKGCAGHTTLGPAHVGYGFAWGFAAPDRTHLANPIPPPPPAGFSFPCPPPPHTRTPHPAPELNTRCLPGSLFCLSLLKPFLCVWLPAKTPTAPSSLGFVSAPVSSTVDPPGRPPTSLLSTCSAPSPPQPCTSTGRPAVRLYGTTALPQLLSLRASLSAMPPARHCTCFVPTLHYTTRLFSHHPSHQSRFIMRCRCSPCLSAYGTWT
jgi:hypothetical protein